MRRRRLSLLGILAAALAFTAWVAARRPLPVLGPALDDGYSRVSGVVHVHTSLSDGGGTPEEVAAEARRAGLGFVAITDHNHLDAKPFEGYHDGVLVVVGTEISTAAGHVLGLGLPDPVHRFSGSPEDALQDVRDGGGVAFATHPTSPRPDFVWHGWDLPGSWGLELMNGDSQWRAAGWGRLARTAALYAVNPRHALLGSLVPPDEALRRWDGLLAERNAAGIVGADAHSRVPISRRFAPRFPSYAALFGLARNHVLLDAPLRGVAADDAAAVAAALGRGRSYVGVDAIAPADAFSFVAESPAGRATMGDTVAPEPRPRFRVRARAPRGATATLLRDGRKVGESAAAGDDGLVFVHDSDGPGVYRVEVRVPGHDLPWILSNAIGVFDEAARARRAARGAWPAPPEPPAPAAPLDDFSATTTFGAEFGGPGSWMDREVAQPGEGPGGAVPAGRLRFRLGTPGPGAPFVWCALVSRKPRDLSGRRGLVFDVRGDGVYRVWVQVRDRNPASADDGTEWWAASVKTSADWRRVAVPFASLRSINPRTDGKLDLDKVVELVFVLDQGAVKPGSQGTIWLSGLAVY